jgi:hypothetical protein
MSVGDSDVFRRAPCEVDEPCLVGPRAPSADAGRVMPSGERKSSRWKEGRGDVCLDQFDGELMDRRDCSDTRRPVGVIGERKSLCLPVVHECGPQVHRRENVSVWRGGDVAVAVVPEGGGGGGSGGGGGGDGGGGGGGGGGVCV